MVAFRRVRRLDLLGSTAAWLALRLQAFSDRRSGVARVAESAPQPVPSTLQSGMMADYTMWDFYVASGGTAQFFIASQVCPNARRILLPNRLVPRYELDLEGQEPCTLHACIDFQTLPIASYLCLK